MGGTTILALSVVGGLALITLFAMSLVAKFYRKVDQGRALIVSKTTGDPIVTFNGGLVLPVIHRAEVMDISVKTIEIDRRGKDGLICRDNIRADIKVTFFVRVNKTSNDVLKVAQNIGCARASDQSTLEVLFNAKFSEALKTVGKGLDFEDLYKERANFRDQIIEVIGKELNGFTLEDAAIDFLEQTPIEHLDADNILDSQGIEKITRITAEKAVATNKLRQTEKKDITEENVRAAEAIMALERQQADAKAKQSREIATVIAREQAETASVQAEERKKSELARIKADEEIAINEENKLRQVEVAHKNRERVVGVETERVERDRSLEAINREREVELQRIAKEKALEVERKAIADVVRGRIAVDKSVAEEEERIKTLRAEMTAKREKDVLIIHAEAEAQERLVKEIKQAEAGEEVAKFDARKRLVLAEAELETSDKNARAKIRLAEGVQAEAAAEGLAAVRVKEANAGALEKEGAAQAKVQLEKLSAEAAGLEKQGLAKARVLEAQAAAEEKRGTVDANVVRLKKLAEAEGLEKEGLAQALVVRETKSAEAEGLEKTGLAGARVREAEAAAREKAGHAEAEAVRERLAAEASGLLEKANAMRALDGAGRQHEEYRIQLEAQKEIELARLAARREIAEAQAKVLAEAMGHAKINIVGGDGQFFDQFVRAVSLGQAMDGAVGSSETLRTVFGDYLNGKASLPADLRHVLSRPALSAGDLASLTVAGTLGKLMVGLDEPARQKVQLLLEKARELGVDQVVASGGSSAADR